MLLHLLGFLAVARWVLPAYGPYAALAAGYLWLAFPLTAFTPIVPWTVRMRIGAPLAVSEFHDPGRDFHQVELFFAARITEGAPSATWADTEGVVNRFRWAAKADMAALRFKPDILPELAFGTPAHALYDPLEPIVP